MYVPLETVITRLSIPNDDWDVLQITLAAMDALKSIDNATSYEQKTILAEIVNHKVRLPKDVVRVEQVALYLNPTQEELSSTLSEDLPEDTTDTIPQQTVNNQVTAIYPLLPWFFSTTKTYQKYFELIKPRRVPFSMTCKTCPHNDYPCNYYFDIDTSNNMIFPQLEDGLVCIAYTAIASDEQGRFLIEDNALLHEALSSYIMSRYHEVNANMSVQGAAELFKYYKQQYSLKKRQYTADSVTRSLDVGAIKQITYGRWDTLLTEAIKYKTTR